MSGLSSVKRVRASGLSTIEVPTKVVLIAVVVAVLLPTDYAFLLQCITDTPNLSCVSITDTDGYYFSSGSVISEEFEAEDELAMTIDFNFDFIISAGDIVDIEVGWFYSTWSDMAQFQGSRTDLLFSPQINGEDRDRISWSGPRVAVVLEFGR